MKKSKIIVALALVAGTTASLIACTPKNVVDEQAIVDAVISNSSILISNKSNPIRDTSFGVSNELAALAGDYIKATTKINYLDDNGVDYDVDIKWDYNTTQFKATEFTDGAHYLELKPIYPEFGTSADYTLKGTATYGSASASLEYKVTAISNKQLVSIENMPASGSVAIRGYVTGFIRGNEKSTTDYGVFIQEGDYSCMLYNGNKSTTSKLKVGDCVEVLGEASTYNGQKQITGSSATVTILSGDDASEVKNPSTGELNDAGLISPEVYCSVATITGAKVLEVEDVPNIYNGSTTEHGYIQAKVLYKGKEMWLFSDRYNTNYDEKVEWYNLLKDACDNNTTKTIKFTGAFAQGKKAVVEGEGENQTTNDKVSMTLPSMMLVGLEGNCSVLDQAYVEVSPVNLKLSGDLYLNSTIKVTAEGEEGDTFTFSSADTSIATVGEDGTVKGVALGSTIITATSTKNPNLSGSIRVKVKEMVGEPEYKIASVAEVLEKENVKNQAYIVRGKVTEAKGDKYGNMVIADETDPTQTITVYGVSGSYGALTFKDGTYSYKNANDALTHETLKNVKVGDTISMLAIRADYKGAKQLNGVLISLNDEMPVATNATLEEVATYTPAGTTKNNAIRYYHSTATIKDFTDNKWASAEKGEYGNMIVQDGDLEVCVYGATGQDGKISYNYKGSQIFSIGNPADFLTNEHTKDLKIGDKIEFDCVRADYSGTVQIVIQNVRKVA